jgi:O-antigen ligase
MALATGISPRLLGYITALLVFPGLYFQALYPSVFVYAVIAFTLGIVLILDSVEHLSFPAITFLVLAIIVAMGMPIFFSKMPVLSFSSGLYLLAGAAALLWMRRENALILLWGVVAYCFLDSFVAGYKLFVMGHTRPDGLFMDSNVRAIYLLSSILFVFWWLTKNSEKTKAQSVSLWTLLLVLMTGFQSTQSRAMFILGGFALIAVGIFSFFKKPRIHKPVLLLVIIAIVGYGLFNGMLQLLPDAEYRPLITSNAMTARWDLWQATWLLILERPWLGHGFGLFEYLYPGVRTEYGTGGFFVHNDFLELWLAAGIPGLLLTLIPVGYFTFQFFASFAKAQYQQTLFAGMGLCLMGFAFFNYFFWRFENLVMMAAVWKLAERPIVLVDFNKSLIDFTSEPGIGVQPKHKFIVFLVLFLPVMTLLAKTDQQSPQDRDRAVQQGVKSWSDWILADESALIPVRARWYFEQAIKGKTETLDYEYFAVLIDQLDSEIERGTLYPSFYCARAEVGYLLNEDLNLSLELISRSKQIDPKNIYCVYALFNLRIANEQSELALKEVLEFLVKPLNLERADAILMVIDHVKGFAENKGYTEYANAYGSVRDLIENRKRELGL